MVFQKDERLGMSYKRKGHLTVSGEWRKHLRPGYKRLYWKSERSTEKNIALKTEDFEGLGFSKPEKKLKYRKYKKKLFVLEKLMHLYAWNFLNNNGIDELKIEESRWAPIAKYAAKRHALKAYCYYTKKQNLKEHYRVIFPDKTIKYLV
jgi:hypothetical protein